MYRISLKDVGSARVTKDVICGAGHLQDAESRAVEVVGEILKGRDIDVHRLAKTEYNICDGHVFIGSFTITKL